MKKIIVLAVGVLLCTLVFANGTEDPTTGSSVVVLNPNGSNLFKVLYRAKSSGNVKISIIDDHDNIVFTEKLHQRDGFVRPYNFKGLPNGTYTIRIDDATGTQLERVNFGNDEAQPFLHVTKLAGETSKYLLSGHFKTEKEIQVSVYDAQGELAFSESRVISGQFGEVYNMKNLPGSFTIEISDIEGVLKTMHY